MLVDPGEPTTGEPRVAVDHVEADILAAFVVGRRVLEIGTGLGVSTRALAGSAAEVYTIDIDPWVHEHIWPGLPSNVRGVESLPFGEFGAIFIDGDHSPAAVEHDIVTARMVAGPGAVILAHDTNAPNVHKHLGPGNWRFIPTIHGLGVLWC